jgi:Vacuolar protein sorting-associated protein 35
MTTPPPPDGGFAPMGGNVGEGMFNDQGMNATGSGNFNEAGNYMQPPSTVYGTTAVPSSASPIAVYPDPPTTPSHQAPMGSITQFASPEMSSVLSGNQQFHQQPAQPNIQGAWHSGSNVNSGVYGASAAAAPGSFAARSAQAHASIPQQQPAMMQPSILSQPFPGQQVSAPIAPGPQYRPTNINSMMDASPNSFAAWPAQAHASMPQTQSGMMQSQYGQPQQQQSPYGQPQQQRQLQYGQQYSQQQQYQYQQQQQYAQQTVATQQPQYSQQQLPAHLPSSAPPAPQVPTMSSYSMACGGDGGSGSSVVNRATGSIVSPGKPQPSWAETPAQIAVQNRLLNDATRKVQEHAYYMRQAMEKNDLPSVLDRASLMVGQLGENHAPFHHGHQAGHPSPSAPPPGGEAAQLNPKNYYELHMRALEDMPLFEEYLMTVSGHGQRLQQPPDPTRITITMTPIPTSSSEAEFSVRELYDCVQYCPQVLPRLYLQICAGSALIQSGEVGTKWVMNDLMQATKCVQNPVRGLFLRHYLLQMIRDKLPDSPAETTPPIAGQSVAASAAVSSMTEDGKEEALTTSTPSVPSEQESGTVVDSYQFILANFIEMNKLWVRIQHLAGDGRSKDQRKRRERQRNELRILVGTNLVRLSQLEGVTSKIYGEVILPTVLDHIVVCGDPLAQAYLIDCITQVFPDEYHIETLPVLLRVCPKLRDKVNVRTILQSLMDRLANYLADEELLDETDTNQVKKNMAQDSFPMLEECVQNVYNARGPKLGAKEVIRLQTALLSFSLRCFKGDMEQVNRCLQGCVAALKQANASYELQEGTMAEVPGNFKPLDDASTAELEKLLSIPLDSLAIKVLQLPHYGELLAWLPWAHRREVALKLLRAVDDAGAPPKTVKDIEELFSMVEPVILGNTEIYNGHQQMGLTMPGQSNGQTETENALICKLIHLLDHDDTDVVYDMLLVARQHINKGSTSRTGQTLVAVVFATFRLAQRVFEIEHGIPDAGKTKAAANAPNENSPPVGEAAPNADETDPPKSEDDVLAEVEISVDEEPESAIPATNDDAVTDSASSKAPKCVRCASSTELDIASLLSMVGLLLTN